MKPILEELCSTDEAIELLNKGEITVVNAVSPPPYKPFGDFGGTWYWDRIKGVGFGVHGLPAILVKNHNYRLGEKVDYRTTDIEVTRLEAKEVFNLNDEERGWMQRKQGQQHEHWYYVIGLKRGS